MFRSIFNPLRSASARSGGIRHPRRNRGTLATGRRPRRKALRLEPLEGRRLLADWAFSLGPSLAITVYDQCVDSIGNLYIAGSFNGTVDFDPAGGTASLVSAGGDDGFVAMYTHEGQFAWVRRVASGPGMDHAKALVLDEYENLYVAGRFQDTAQVGDVLLTDSSSIYGEAFVLKYDSAGTVHWVEHWSLTSPANDLTPLDIAADTDGNLYVAGQFDAKTAHFGEVSVAAGTIPRDAFVVKLRSADHRVLWAWHTEGPGAAVARAIVVGDNGDLYVGGQFGDLYDRSVKIGSQTLTARGSTDMYVAMLHDSGDEVLFRSVWQMGGDYRNTGSGGLDTS